MGRRTALDTLARQPAADALDFGVSPVALLEARAAVEPAIASLAAPRFTPTRRWSASSP